MMQTEVKQPPSLLNLPRNLVISLRHIMRREGWHAMVKLALNPLFETHDAYILAHPLTNLTPPVERMDDVELREIVLADLPLLAPIVPPLRLHRLEKKIAAGEIGSIALKEGEIVSMAWFCAADGLSARETSLKLDKSDAYLWGAYTAPQARSLGLASATLTRQLYLAQQQGYERALLVTEKNNQITLHILPKYGFQIIAGLRSVRLLKWWWARFTPIETESN